MHTLTQTARPARRFAPFARLLAWILARDAAYRSACELAEMPDERLADIGLTREEANTAFLRRYATRGEPPRFGW